MEQSELSTGSKFSRDAFGDPNILKVALVLLFLAGDEDEWETEKEKVLTFSAFYLEPEHQEDNKIKNNKNTKYFFFNTIGGYKIQQL